MIKARGFYRDRPLAILGLSHDNVANLFADEPILIDLADPKGMAIEGAPMVIIIAGKTEASMVDDLAKHGLMPPPEGIRYDDDGRP